jgi:hypothetical protein
MVEPTPAEVLLELAQAVLLPREQVIAFCDGETGSPLATHGPELVKVAIDFCRKPKGFQFRAIMEKWDRFRINREMY